MARPIVLAACLQFMAGVSLAAEAQSRVFSFGVVPQQTAMRMAKSWIPLTNYLRAKTGHEFRFATAKNITAFHEAIAHDKYDFAYLNPYHYVRNSGTARYQALAHARDRKIRGILVVSTRSRVRTLEELQNAEVAFPSRTAFAATQVVNADLRARNIHVKPVYLASHDTVYEHIARGHYAAGGGVKRTLALLPLQVRNQLRVLYVTKGYTPHAIAGHARVPESVRMKVQAALVNIDQDEEGRRVLKILQLKGMQAANDSDWDDVRRDFNTGTE